MSRTAALPRALARRIRSLDKPTRMGLAVVLAVSAGAAGTLTLASPASAAVPTFPDNIVVFPDRDFISVDGFDDHLGETATVTVTRPGVGVVGAAQATIDGGSPSFEINHPGGSCWGNFTGAPNVTPDIVAGDVVTVKVGNTLLGDTRSLSGTLADVPPDDAITLSGTTLTIRGTLGPDVNPLQVEQRIVEPALTGTEIARRDVRALPGPVTLDARGQYSSGMTITGNTFVATYQFQNAGTAAIAAEGGARFMAWEVEDGDANRQGLTIAEFGEPGGPGMGGCPNGPRQSGPAAPEPISAVQQSNGDIKLVWTPATAVPGTAAITGYRVRVWEKTNTPPVVENEIGRRINDVASTGVTIPGTVGTDYNIEVTSVSETGETFPPATPALLLGDTQPPTVTTAPALAATDTGTSFPAPTEVRLSSESNSQIYYILFSGPGSAPALTDGDTVTNDAVRYTGPINVTQDSVLFVTAFDQAGNLAPVVEYPITITSAPPTSEPRTVLAVPAVGGATVTWTAPATIPGDAPVTGYTVRAYPGTTQADATGSPAKTVTVGNVLTASVTGLNPVPHVFTVTATNAAGESQPSAVAAATPTAEVLAVATNQTVLRPAPLEAGKQVTLSGLGSTVGATYLWTQDLTSTGTNRTPVVIQNPGSLLAASFTMPPTAATATAAQTMAPFVFKLSVSLNGVTRTATSTVTVANNTVSVATARFRTSELRLTGSTTSAPGATTVRLYYRNSTGTMVFIGNATLTAGATPGASSTYDARFRPAPAGMATGNPVFAFTTNSAVGNTAGGAQAGPFTPSN